MKNENKKILVTFSGGRDSSAASLELAKKGFEILLFTFKAESFWLESIDVCRDYIKYHTT